MLNMALTGSLPPQLFNRHPRLEELKVWRMLGGWQMLACFLCHLLLCWQ